MRRNNHCILCGKELDEMNLENGFHIQTTCKYGSEFDGDLVDFHLCVECGDSYIKHFKDIGLYDPVIDRTEYNILTGNKLTEDKS